MGRTIRIKVERKLSNGKEVKVEFKIPVTKANKREEVYNEADYTEIAIALAGIFRRAGDSNEFGSAFVLPYLRICLKAADFTVLAVLTKDTERIRSIKDEIRKRIILSMPLSQEEIRQAIRDILPELYLSF